MGRRQYLSAAEWLKYSGKLELADFFNFRNVLLPVFIKCSVRAKASSSLSALRSHYIMDSLIIIGILCVEIRYSCS